MPDDMPQKLNVADLKLTSTAFHHHERIPDRHSGDAEGDTYNGIENLTGTGFADTLTGGTAAETINAGSYTSARFRALMTAAVAGEMKATIGTDVGLHYPGPVPFTPIRVTVASTTSRRIDSCFVSTGFAQKPGTGRPAKALKIIPVRATETVTGGRWLLSQLISTTAFSCSGVKVAMPTWQQ